MKTKLLLFGLLSILSASCYYPRYLSSHENIDINSHGSYIRITPTTGPIIHGELIAIESNKIMVLSEVGKIGMAVPLSEMKRFSLRYAKPRHYGWTIPVFTLSTLMHGWILIFTAPANLIVTILATVTGESSYVYSYQDVSLDELRMFARFPQGMPPDIELAEIR